jgi:ABC-type lipoprotein export system ATPase subunit
MAENKSANSNPNVSESANAELLEVRRLTLTMEGRDIIRDANFSITERRGCRITGAGDETDSKALKTIGGIHPPLNPHTRIFFQGTDIYEAAGNELKKIKKKIAFIFREGTLISNITIKENLLLPLKYHYPDCDMSAVMERIAEDFYFFQIPPVLDKRPAEVSYCLKKKLALIRASLREPELILVDRPLFNLEGPDREQVVRYLEALKQKGKTFIFVSRSPEILQSLIDETITLHNERTEERKPGE